MGVPDGAREALAAGWAADRIAQWGLATGLGATALAEAWAAGIERDLSAAGYVVVKAEETRTEYSVQGSNGKPLYGPLDRQQAIEIAATIGACAIKREVSVGPWVPVSGEENKDG